MERIGRIIATVYSPAPGAARAEAECALSSGADAVEIRIDAFTSPLEARGLFDLCGRVPVIFSGNRRRATREELAVLEEARRLGAFADVPIGADAPEVAPMKGERLILSHHGQVGSGAELRKLAEEMLGRAAYAKIVPPREDMLECARYLEWTREASGSGRLVSFPSGEESAFARVLALSRGSAAVYCLSSGSAVTVPGQLRLDELLSYRPGKITGATAVTGLLGHPLASTPSPRLWNGWFSATSTDAVYLPFPSRRAERGVVALELLGVRFFAVTSPHKVTCAGLVGKLSRAAAECSSVNTVMKPGGAMLGANTDMYGVRRATAFLGRGVKVLVLGNGGAARAAVAALGKTHRVSISARREDALADAAGGLGVPPVAWEEKEGREWDLVVNATSAGSDGVTVPWDPSRGLKLGSLLEMVVMPGGTPFEAIAARAGARVVPGIEMLRHQARLQFGLFFGKKPPRVTEDL